MAGSNATAERTEGRVTDEIDRTSRGLRELLFKSIEKTMRGEMDPKVASSVCALADRVIASARLDADVAVALADVASDAEAPKVIGFSNG